MNPQSKQILRKFLILRSRFGNIFSLGSADLSAVHKLLARAPRKLQPHRPHDEMLRLLAISAGAAAAVGQTYDVVVYGATPAGIQTCLAVANEGNTCALVHPLGHIGGMITGGLGQTDIGTASVVGGAAHDFFVRIGAAYGKANTAQYTFEPSVAQQVFASLLANVSGKVDVITSQTLATVNKQGAAVASITTVPSAFANSAPLDIQGADLVRLYERPSLSNIRGNKLAAVAESSADRLRFRASTYTAKVRGRHWLAGFGCFG